MSSVFLKFDAWMEDKDNLILWLEQNVGKRNVDWNRKIIPANMLTHKPTRVKITFTDEKYSTLFRLKFFENDKRKSN